MKLSVRDTFVTIAQTVQPASFGGKIRQLLVEKEDLPTDPSRVGTVVSILDVIIAKGPGIMGSESASFYIVLAFHPKIRQRQREDPETTKAYDFAWTKFQEDVSRVKEALEKYEARPGRVKSSFLKQYTGQTASTESILSILNDLNENGAMRDKAKGGTETSVFSLKPMREKIANALQYVTQMKESAENAKNLATRNQQNEQGSTVRGVLFGKGRRKTLRSKFNHCVKAVKKTVKARKGSSKESAAIGICTTSVLHPRGRTIKRYRRGRLTTQKKFRGGQETF